MLLLLLLLAMIGAGHINGLCWRRSSCDGILRANSCCVIITTICLSDARSMRIVARLIDLVHHGAVIIFVVVSIVITMTNL